MFTLVRRTVHRVTVRVLYTSGENIVFSLSPLGVHHVRDFIHYIYTWVLHPRLPRPPIVRRRNRYADNSAQNTTIRFTRTCNSRCVINLYYYRARFWRIKHTPTRPARISIFRFESDLGRRRRRRRRHRVPRHPPESTRPSKTSLPSTSLRSQPRHLTVRPTAVSYPSPSDHRGGGGGG